MKKDNSFLILLLCANLILFGTYKYFQPLCEPCLPNTDCPPCVSGQQEFIMYYLTPFLNVFLIGLHLFFRRNR